MMLTALCHDIGKAYHFEDVQGNPQGKYEVQRMNRRRFLNHESMSFFEAIDVVNAFDVSMDIKNRILKTVAMHGDLYNYFDETGIPEKHHKTIAEKYDYETFLDLKNFYYCDVKGRISSDNQEKLAFVTKGMNAILDIIQLRENSQEEELEGAVLTLLVGPPRVGKSTYISKTAGEEIVISRDNALMLYGKEKYGNDLMYNEIWDKLSSDDQKNIDRIIIKDFEKAAEDGKDIVIDMTNMSKKSRRKWVNNVKVKDYHKQAIVFCESPKTLFSRKEKGKNIPEHVTYNFMKSFSFPKLEELDAIATYFDNE